MQLRTHTPGPTELLGGIQMMKKFVLLLLILALLSPGISLLSQEKKQVKDIPAKNVAANEDEGSNQLIIWSSGDREVALKLAFMYAYNCKKYQWMDTVRLLVWGPSAKLLSTDKELQEKIKKMKEQGVQLWACKGCADMYGVSKKLEELGIKVHYTGKALAEMQKTGWHVLTF